MYCLGTKMNVTLRIIDWDEDEDDWSPLSILKLVQQLGESVRVLFRHAS